MGTLLHSCVKFCEEIKLSFGVVSGVGPGIGVLDGVHIPRVKEKFWGFFWSIGF